jgi:hypothetical protein
MVIGNLDVHMWNIETGAFHLVHVIDNTKEYRDFYLGPESVKVLPENREQLSRIWYSVLVSISSTPPQLHVVAIKIPT